MCVQTRCIQTLDSGVDAVILCVNPVPNVTAFAFRNMMCHIVIYVYPGPLQNRCQRGVNFDDPSRDDL